MLSRLKATLLHYANSTTCPLRSGEFYDLKAKLLRKYATRDGNDIQEIRKECWGPWIYDEPIGCQGTRCLRCGGTGVFDLRWINLIRWKWHGYVFHTPDFDSRVPIGLVTINGRIEHRDYGRASTEAALWLYLLCGQWKTLWRSLRGSYYSRSRWYPFLNLQWIVMHTWSG